MYKICKTEQSAARQRAIEQGLLQAMLSRDYEDISVSDLCDQMKIPRKSFYRYFSGKDGALFALLDHTLLEFTQTEPKFSICAAAMGDLETFFQFWHGHQNLLRALVRSRMGDILAERATDHAVREGMMPKYLLKKTVDEQRMAMTFVVFGLISMVIRWHTQGYRESPQEMAIIASRMIFMHQNQVNQ